MSISNETRGRIKRVFEPIALWMGRLGLTPDGLTLIGFGITGLGAASLALQLWLVGGLLLIVGGVFDMFDGTLARATGTVSPFGAFLDSVFDRAGEVIVYLGIVWGSVLAAPSSSEIGLLGSDIVVILAAAAMGAAFMVSYTRARSEGLGFTAGTRMAAVGVMPREVRLLILSLGLILTGATASFAFLAIALAIIAIGATITVIQRILHVRNQAESATNPIL